MTLKFEVGVAMKNLTCCDLKILLVVIWLVLTRFGTEEINF